MLTCDIQAYFPSIDHAILKALLRRKLKAKRLLALLDHISEPPLLDALPGKGLPIGNLTGQYFANLYLGELDHSLKDRLRVKGYLHYIREIYAVFQFCSLLVVRERVGVRVVSRAKTPLTLQAVVPRRY